MALIDTINRLIGRAEPPQKTTADSPVTAAPNSGNYATLSSLFAVERGRVARINEAPKELNIHFIKSDTVPGGLGEPGTAVVQPAIANAIFAASGKRPRTLPFTTENIKAG